MQSIHDKCRMFDVAFDWPTFLSLGTQALANGTSRGMMSMYPSRCSHARTHACNPWLMLPVIFKQRLPYANMQRLMQGPLEAFESMARILT